MSDSDKLVTFRAVPKNAFNDRDHNLTFSNGFICRLWQFSRSFVI